MDYHRIYREFIADRKAKATPSGYTERHHILPRSLGGGDEAENLIDLSADDHYFAHLLLARMHGGSMGSALFLLVQRAEQNWKGRYYARRSYGLAQRLAAKGLAERWIGDANPLFNATAIDWANYRSGERCSATLYEMHHRHGASRASWTSVATGARPSIKGWMPTARLEQHKRSEKGQRFTFVNRDGRTFRGTQGEFAKAHGINLASASRIARHRSVSECGWRLQDVPDRPANYAKDGLPARQKR